MNKRWFYLLTIIMAAPLLAPTFDATYKKLAKRPAFLDMTFIEIAADRQDYPALAHFLIDEADQDVLKRTANILQVQLYFLK